MPKAIKGANDHKFIDFVSLLSINIQFLFCMRLNSNFLNLNLMFTGIIEI